jgi:hypothetical protein
MNFSNMSKFELEEMCRKSLKPDVRTLRELIKDKLKKNRGFKDIVMKTLYVLHNGEELNEVSVRGLDQLYPYQSYIFLVFHAVNRIFPRNHNDHEVYKIIYEWIERMLSKYEK